MNWKKWSRATAIRCARTFITTILGVWTAGTLITDVDWKTTLLAALSATVYIFLVCLVGGLPEVDETPDITPEFLDEITNGREEDE